MYHTIANICKRTEAGGSLKSILYKLPKENEKDLPSIRALADTTLRNKSTLDDLINKTQLAKELCFSDVWIARVLVAELVFGRRSYNCTDVISTKVYKYKEELKSHLGDSKKKALVYIPRYVRVNTTKCTKKQLHLSLSEEFKLKQSKGKYETTYSDFLKIVKRLKKNEYIEDYHVPNLFIFNPKVKFANRALYEEKKIILQDKASCLVAPLLSPTPGSIMLDMCAAPGFKTQHLATIAGLSGCLFSVDINTDRYDTLKQTKSNYELSNVLTFNTDSLHLPEELTKYIEYILLDAPCSGSGVVQNYDYGSIESSKYDEKRLRSLHNLQAYLLRTALTNYPSVRRIVYSTCSINEEENEAVIDELIGIAAENEFVLVDLRNHLPDFTFGLEKYISGKYCIRLLPEESCTNGFFIALFERTNPPKAEKRKDFYSSFNKIINCIGKKKRKASETESNHGKNVENNINENINKQTEIIDDDDDDEELNPVKKAKINLDHDENLHDNNVGINGKTPFSPSSNNSNNSNKTPSKNASDKNKKPKCAASSEDSSSSSTSSSSDDDDDDDDDDDEEEDKNEKKLKSVEQEKNVQPESNIINIKDNERLSPISDCEPTESNDKHPDSGNVSGIENKNSPNRIQNPPVHEQYCENNWQNNRNFNRDTRNYNSNFDKDDYYKKPNQKFIGGKGRGGGGRRGGRQLRNDWSDNFRRGRRGRMSWAPGE